MQPEHVIYALSGLAVEAQKQNHSAFAEMLVYMTLNPEITARLAALLTESDEDELVQHLIEERIKDEQRRRISRG